MTLDEDVLNQLITELGTPVYSGEWVFDTTQYARSKIASHMRGEDEYESPEDLDEMFTALWDWHWYYADMYASGNWPAFGTATKESGRWLDRALEILIGRSLPGRYQSILYQFLQ